MRGLQKMSNELVRVSPAGGQIASVAAKLPELVKRAGGAARFAGEEFFFAEHHNPHTQWAYESAVRRFLDWAEGQGGRGGAGEHFAGHGGPVSRRLGRLSGEA